MSIASASNAASTSVARQLQKQAQAASTAATDLAQQVQRQDRSGAAQQGVAAGGQKHGAHGDHSTGSTADSAASIATGVANASGINQVA